MFERGNPMDGIDKQLNDLRGRIAEAIAVAGDLAAPAEIMALGPFVRKRRKQLGWTLDDLARHADTTKSHVWSIENGKAPNPTVRMVDALARALGVPLIHLCAAVLRED
jgi:DNA-binding XRE family transcriptional regulator